MSLSLDARQRAMLLEMGVRLWHAPGSAAAAASAALPHSAADRRLPTRADSDVPPSQPSATPFPASHVRSSSAPALQPKQAVAPAVANSGWSLLPTRLLYPDANPALAPSALGAGWLLVTHAVDASEPWAQGAERLLAAMLQALQLHLHPRVALCALQSAVPGAAGGLETADITADIAAQVAAFAPSVVLVMGRGPVRAALGLTEPLAKLREQDLRIAGVPVVATYDAPFLLRNPQCKRPAWADLCRARELARTRHT